MDYARRLTGLQDRMREEDADLVVYGTCQNYQYLTGLLIDWRAAPDMRQRSCDLFVPREGPAVATAAGPLNLPPSVELRTLAPGQDYADLVKSVVADLKVRPGKVGVGMSLHGSVYTALFENLSNAALADATTWNDRFRAIKEPEELDRLRATAKLTEDVMEHVIGGIGRGSTQKELMLQIETEGHRRGASHVSFAPFVGFMRSGHGASEHIANVDPDEGLEPGTAICFDVGFVLDGYASDWGRSVYWGKPAPFIVDAHTALRESVLEVVGTLKDGSRKAMEMYPAIVQALDDRGFGDQIRRRLAGHKGIGHSIGVEVHERPWLGYTVDEYLREDMVVAIEPKVWHPGEYYLRLEELVHITRDGAEFLTNFDRDLFVL